MALRTLLNNVAYEELGEEMTTQGSFGIEPGTTFIAGQPAVITLVYEIGVNGVAPGGKIEFLFPPLWVWQEGQLKDERRPDFVAVDISRKSVTYLARMQAFLKGDALPGVGIEITGPDGLQEGDVVTVRYGKETSEQAGVRADRWASITPFGNRLARFGCRVDADGSGTLVDVSRSPVRVDVAPDAPAELIAHAPSILTPGERAAVKCALVDRNRNVLREADMRLCRLNGAGVVAPTGKADESESGLAAGRVSIEATCEGVARVEVTEERTGLARRVNPMVVRRDPGERIFWGDIHGHSNESDGAGSSEDYFRYARDVAGLDFTSLTDHDDSLAAAPAHWERTKELTQRFNASGEFVTLLGFEWSSQAFGHRNVYYRGEDGPVFSYRGETSNTPRELWKLLEPYECIVVPHHSPGIYMPLSLGFASMDWSRANDDLERLVEIFSCHGNSERLGDEDNFALLTAGGHFVEDALSMGRKLGLLASSDSHNGHPGLTGHYDYCHYDPEAKTDWVRLYPRNQKIKRPSRDKMRGCLTAVYASELSREAVYDALKARRCYATTGTRPIVSFSVNGAPMGSITTLTDAREIEASVVSSQGIRGMEVFRGEDVVERLQPESDEGTLYFTDREDVPRGTFYYLRVIEESGDKAWTSPVWLA